MSSRRASKQVIASLQHSPSAPTVFHDTPSVYGWLREESQQEKLGTPLSFQIFHLGLYSLVNQIHPVMHVRTLKPGRTNANSSSFQALCDVPVACKTHQAPMLETRTRRTIYGSSSTRVSYNTILCVGLSPPVSLIRTSKLDSW